MKYHPKAPKGATFRKSGSIVAAASVAGHCPRCNSSLSGAERLCATCSLDVGAPNVRDSGCANERRALKKRFEAAEKDARTRRCLHEFSNFGNLLKEHSGVVVAMPAAAALSLASDPKMVYTNYETLTGSGIRQAAAMQNDKQRRAVAGMLFGTYGDKLRYGILSLTPLGLPTYGEIHCRLRTIAIEDRTSFLECNSYHLVKNHGVAHDSPLPAGHKAVWDNRHCLALIKLGGGLRPKQCKADWETIMFKTDGKNRREDDFIEALIYEGFNLAAIENMAIAPDARLDKGTKLIAKSAIERFQASGGK
jgi:hypothetical protein